MRWLKKFLVTVLICAVLILISVNYRYIPKEAQSKMLMTKVQSQVTVIEAPVDNVSKGVHYVNIIKLVSKEHTFLKATLRSGGVAVLIYVHNNQDMISSSIINYGVWESWLVNQFADYIKANPGIQVFDAGCNIGVYTLVSAALGANVVSVDANPINTERLSQSVISNGFESKVMISLNALTNVRKEFVMTVNEKNIGGQNILEDHKSASRVKSIFIDDLVPFFNNSLPVMIKIDIETREIEAFQKAAYFFSSLNVRVVLIEWMWIKNNADIKYLLDFFSKRKFVPYGSFLKTTPLNLTEYISWPGDVVWFKM